MAQKWAVASVVAGVTLLAILIVPSDAGISGHKCVITNGGCSGSGPPDGVRSNDCQSNSATACVGKKGTGCKLWPSPPAEACQFSTRTTDKCTDTGDISCGDTIEYDCVTKTDHTGTYCVESPTGTNLQTPCKVKKCNTAIP